MKRKASLLVVSCVAVAALTLSGARVAGSSPPGEDFVCSERRLTLAAFEALLPVKAQGRGYFSCTGSLTVFNEVTSQMISSIDFGEVLISTLWDEGCGCMVTSTTFFGTTLVTPEYGVKRGVSCVIGVFSDPPESAPLYGESQDSKFNWRNISYVNPATGVVSRIQIFKPIADRDVVIHLMSYGASGKLQSFVNFTCDFLHD